MVPWSKSSSGIIDPESLTVSQSLKWKETSDTETELDDSKNTASNKFKLGLLVLVVVQNSAAILVGRFTRTSLPATDLYDINHFIVIAELLKFIFSALLEFHSSSGKLLFSLDQHVIQKPLDALKVAVPSFLYLIQNTLIYSALANLTVPVFQVTNQGKLVATALLSVIILERRYTIQQWVCLIGLSLGVAVVILDQTEGDADVDKKHDLLLGLSAMAIASFCSASAGVYFEKVLKAPSDENQQPMASLWMRNMQMAFFCFSIGVVQSFSQKANIFSERSYLHGFTAWVWVSVLLQAGGGLLIAAVIQHLDNVYKGLATGVSVVLSSSLSTIIFGSVLGMQFCAGTVMILSSVYFFSNPLPDLSRLESITTLVCGRRRALWLLITVGVCHHAVFLFWKGYPTLATLHQI